MHSSRKLALGLFVLVWFASTLACSQSSSPNVQATVDAAVKETIAVRDYTPTAPPDVRATVDESVSATLTVQAYTPTPAVISCVENSGGKIFRKYEPDTSAEIINLPAPEITPDALNHKEEAVGSMQIELILAPCGIPDDMVFRGFSPYGLAIMATKAAKAIQYVPATNNGLMVPQRLVVEYEFYLCEDGLCSTATEVVE